MIITDEASLEFYCSILIDKLTEDNNKGANFDLIQVQKAIEIARGDCIEKHQKSGWPCYSNPIFLARLVSDYTKEASPVIAAILLDVSYNNEFDAGTHFNEKIVKILKDLQPYYKGKKLGNLELMRLLIHKSSIDAVLIKLCAGIYDLQTMWARDHHKQQLQILNESKELLSIALDMGHLDLAFVMYQIMIREEIMLPKINA